MILLTIKTLNTEVKCVLECVINFSYKEKYNGHNQKSYYDIHYSNCISASIYLIG